MSASAPLTPRQVFQTLDAISRTRALSEVESRALERAIAAIEARPDPARAAPRPWLEHELQAVRVATRIRGPGRPRRGDRSIAVALAIALDRTPEAISQCMKRIRAERWKDVRR